jgi:hydroxymethylglutaryl-CoA reductase
MLGKTISCGSRDELMMEYNEMKNKSQSSYLQTIAPEASLKTQEFIVQGFSKLNKKQKIEWIAKNLFHQSPEVLGLLSSFWLKNEQHQDLLDEFSENTLTTFPFPFGVCPNVMINDKVKMIPMVIEESSVVAACSKAAKFWLERGGFHAQVLGMTKIGQVHFIWKGDPNKLKAFFDCHKDHFLREIAPLMDKMVERGGGLKNLELRDLTHLEADYYQLWAEFDTCDAMGANFINTVLEALGKVLKDALMIDNSLSEASRDVQIVMCILSNYTPDCRVRAWVECKIQDLYEPELQMSAEDFAQKFARAVRIAKIDVNRATTHNKGIFNGIDAVVLATGNDFRAIEACGHTWAARDGQYRGLTDIQLIDDRFIFSLEIPLAVGTVGGLTALHPLSKFSLELLGRPNAAQLMEVLAVIGLAQNFAALKSLTTSGIQKGHMKMHLMNILKHLEAGPYEIEKAKDYFEHAVVSFSAVRQFLHNKRNSQ